MRRKNLSIKIFPYHKKLGKFSAKSLTKSLGESPHSIQLPTPFLADTSGEEGDGIGEAGGDGGDIGEPEEVRGVMTEVIGYLLAESESFRTATRLYFLSIK